MSAYDSASPTRYQEKRRATPGPRQLRIDMTAASSAWRAQTGLRATGPSDISVIPCCRVVFGSDEIVTPDKQRVGKQNLSARRSVVAVQHPYESVAEERRQRTARILLFGILDDGVHARLPFRFDVA